jgi:enolase-phosphatase E1
MPMRLKAVVTDIEGTTTSLAFVKEVLFPYARERLGSVVVAEAESPFIQGIIAEVKALQPSCLTLAEAVAQLEAWSDADLKVAPLKALQGHVWQFGYEQGHFTGHVYPDAVAALRQWHAQGLALYVYSSGSVQAQKLLFGYSDAGDLTPLFSSYFDTTLGAKKEPASYTRLAETVTCHPDEILFVSDHADELWAADQAGLQVLGVNRDDHEALKPNVAYGQGVPVVKHLPLTLGQ